MEKNKSENQETLENQLAEAIILQKNHESQISAITTEKNQTIATLESKIDDLEKTLEKNSLILKDLESEIQTLKENLKICNSQLSDRNTSILSMQSTIDELSHLSKSLESQLSASEANVHQLESEKSLHDPHLSLSEISKNPNKRPLHYSETSEFERGLDRSLEERLNLETNAIAVVRAVLYDSHTWCLVRFSNPDQKYERNILEEIHPGVQCPVPYEVELEEKIERLNEDCKQVMEIRELHFPEELQKRGLFEVVEIMLACYVNSRKTVARPIQVTEYDPDLHQSPVSGLEVGNSPDSAPEALVQVTAEEANHLFQKMKDLEEENMELENRIMLLNQQLMHFKNEGKVNQFSAKSTATIDQVKSISVSLFEKLPVQADDVESNIKVMLEIMGMNKDAQQKLNERRGIKAGPVRKSSFTKLFSKQKP